MLFLWPFTFLSVYFVLLRSWILCFGKNITLNYQTLKSGTPYHCKLQFLWIAPIAKTLVLVHTSMRNNLLFLYWTIFEFYMEKYSLNFAYAANHDDESERRIFRKNLFCFCGSHTVVTTCQICANNMAAILPYFGNIQWHWCFDIPRHQLLRPQSGTVENIWHCLHRPHT